MNATIITIGDEILIGQTVDTNSAFISSELMKLGIKTERIHSIPDRGIDIIKTLDESIQNSDLVIITGGLGPTSDDITKTILTAYFGGNPVIDPNAMQYIQKLLDARGVKPMERNIRQAEVPDTCIPLLNKNGSAPGMLFEKDGTTIISLPGVPFEMKGIMLDEVIPYIQRHFTLPVRIHKTILTSGLPESGIAEMLNDWESDKDEYTGIAYLPSPGIVKLRIYVSGDNKDQLKHKLNHNIDTVTNIIGERFIFGFDEDTLEGVTGKLLKDRNQTVSCAESCTGGKISHRITSVPGSSDYFKGAVVAYSNEIKENILGVDSEKLKKYGAVSKEVVEEMATGVRELMQTDYGVATSGIAGPGGGTQEKPVGTTWVAIAYPGGVYAKLFRLGDHRGRNIERTTVYALNILRNVIIGKT